jgi:type III secretion protein J
MKRLRVAAAGGLCGLCLLLTACGQQELYGQLSERQANEMVAVLRNAGLSSQKERREGQLFAVSTPQGSFSRAVEVLRATGYPREQFDTLGQIFKKEGFVSSPLEEHARLMHALSQEIANTIASIDGVVMARVHLAVPEREPLSDKPRVSSASVFIKHRPGVDLNPRVDKIKGLVVNGIEGLPYENVTVALFPAEAWPTSATDTAASASTDIEKTLLLLALAGAAVAGASGGFWLWQRRKAGRTNSVALVGAQGDGHAS